VVPAVTECHTACVTEAGRGGRCRTAVGVRCKDGVVLGFEKLIVSKMLVEGSSRRIMTVRQKSPRL
jgi:20S proteasome alpha/beta subunit